MSSESEVRDGKTAVSATIKDIQPDFQLIETMRWEPALGIIRQKLHMARLESSGRVLGFQFNMEAIEQRLAQNLGGMDSLRVRLTLAPDGAVDITTAAFQPLAPGTVWRIAIATTALSSSNPLLRHKTTRRQVYNVAREEFSASEIDEVILLNERGEICEGTITSIFIDRGDAFLITPPLESGLLDGVLRRELIGNMKAREQVIRFADLIAARRVFVGNSLRGLIPAALTR